MPTVKDQSYSYETTGDYEIAMTAEISAALSHGKNCVVAIGVSGGKDSTAVAISTTNYLREQGFAGEIVLIHSDLGQTEWRQSIVKCRELAAHLGLELIEVARRSGGMMERWEQRWSDNVKRFAELSCVKLILPWSTASMRFCTSELKVAPITSELKKRYNGHCIINVTGIRRQESNSPNCGRAVALVSKPNNRLKHKTVNKETGLATIGYDWCPIIDWKIESVWKIADEAGLDKHEAYAKYGMSRVSCAFCMLAAKCDMKNATKADQNHDLYRRQVQLEIESTFSFQGTWLGDVTPELLTADQREALEAAKAKADRRSELEAAIPESLLYVKGWPVGIPTPEEAEVLANFRREIASLLGIEIGYTTADAVIRRYQELMDKKAEKKSA